MHASVLFDAGIGHSVPDESASHHCRLGLTKIKGYVWYVLFDLYDAFQPLILYHNKGLVGCTQKIF